MLPVLIPYNLNRQNFSLGMSTSSEDVDLVNIYETLAVTLTCMALSFTQEQIVEGT